MPRQENIQKRREYSGPAFFSGGFRPFFFGAGMFAIINVALWVAYVSGHGVMELHLSASWHAHEMLFGFVAAAVAGFALTAIPNWTGRLPLRGWPLASLFSLWVAGRVLMATMPDIAPYIDVLFLLSLTLFAGREVFAGKNWRNLPIVMVFAVFTCANILFHLDANGILILDGAGNTSVNNTSVGFRLGVASIAMLLSIIGGRIVPSFTENWFKSQSMSARTKPFNWFDKSLLLITLFILLTWVISPNNPPLIWGFCSIAGLHLIRLSQWSGWHTIREPIVLMLHLSYLWLPISFTLLAVEISTGLNNLGIHALTTGAMASMIVAVMTRATLGHSGKSIKADMATIITYVSILLAGVTRVASFFVDTNYINWLQLSATLWVVGFAMFVLSYSRYFFTKRKL